jgi:hypothetical protein
MLAALAAGLTSLVSIALGVGGFALAVTVRADVAIVRVLVVFCAGVAVGLGVRQPFACGMVER